MEASKQIRYKDWDIIVEYFWEGADPSVGIGVQIIPQNFIVVGDEDNEEFSAFLYDRYVWDKEFAKLIDKLVWED